METMNELSGYYTPASDAEVEADRPGMRSSSEDELPRPMKPTVKHENIKSISAANVPVSAAMLKRFDFIPMRLTEMERKMLQVLENALEVCEYTDVVDVTFSHTRKSKLSRILESLVDMLSISCGLLVSALQCMRSV
jgi:hypothetical protein